MERVAFIVEGHTEKIVLTSILKKHFEINTEIPPDGIFVYSTNSGKIFSEFTAFIEEWNSSKEDLYNSPTSLDLDSLIRKLVEGCGSAECEQRESFLKFLKNNQIARYYFLFDLDIHQTNGNRGKIDELWKKLISLYDRNNTNLFQEYNLEIFISYPMLEAFRDFIVTDNQITLRPFVIYRAEKNDYSDGSKSGTYKYLVFVNDNEGANLKCLEDKDKFSDWLRCHYRRASKLCNESNPEQSLLAKAQYEAFKVTQGKIYVLSALPFLLHSYLGKEKLLEDAWKASRQGTVCLEKK